MSQSTLPAGGPAPTASSRTEAGILLRIALPLWAGYVAEVAMWYTDMAAVGRLGSVELAAVGLAGDVLFEVLFILMGLVSIAGVLVAQALGANSIDDAAAGVRQGLWVSLAVSIPGTVLCWWLADLLSFTGQDPRVIELGRAYMEALSWCVLPLVAFSVLRSFMAALSRTRAVMVVTVGVAIVKPALTIFLVFGVGDWPGLGVAGAGWATSIDCWIILAALGLHIVRTPALKRYRLLAGPWGIDLSLWREIFRLGLPVAGMTLAEGAMFVAIAILAGRLGADVLAACQIVLNWMTLAFVAAISLGEAAMVRVAYAMGQGNPLRARRVGLLGGALTLIAMTAAGVVAVAAPGLIGAIFLDGDTPGDLAVLSLTAELLAIAALFQLFDGLQAVMSRALRGLKDTLAPLWIAGAGYWVLGIPGGYLLAFPLQLGGAGLWWGLAIGLCVAGVLLAVRFERHTRALIAVNDVRKGPTAS
jgi:MATE family multidrug resistance protein